ncbi:sporulation histidine kinase inhibitor Sda [Paenibacillus beijingensis]|uniref:Sporulation inhibitor A n=1 Tax=Paenibacillus beijingensis TaxID=1126833 RepID=A0A0D5NJD1_9BACL|nr:sporulation histidine kinase inhibitor Sda [Paenibacillus beijingensis]AJY75038.1 hypothetical protein VN24_11175 [Paenibacillus beijingensis]
MPRLYNPILSVVHLFRLLRPRRRSASFRKELPVDKSSVTFDLPPMPDKTMLLQPLNDEHLLEVYEEAKQLRLSEEFIELIEQTLEQRNLRSAYMQRATAHNE